MKIRLIRPLKVRNPHFSKRRLLAARRANTVYLEQPYVWAPEGTEIEHPNAAFYVFSGIAEPADAECELFCKLRGFDADKFEKAKLAYDRTEKGIAPEDFEFYDKGLMDGYDPETGEPTLNGNPANIPGYFDNEDDDDGTAD